MFLLYMPSCGLESCCVVCESSPGFGLLFLSSDSDRFRPCQVRIRIGFVGPGLDSDRFRRARFGFGSVSPGQVRIRIGFGKAYGLNYLPAIAIASGGHTFITETEHMHTKGLDGVDLNPKPKTRGYLYMFTPAPPSSAFS